MILYYNPKNKKYAKQNRKQCFMTEAEGKIWNLVLKKDQTGYRFLRQKPIGNYILDFYCAKLKLWIEIDDKSHDRKWEQDEIRTQYLNKLWIKILRYTNDNIYYQLDSVIIDLNTRLKERENEFLLTNCLPSNEGSCSEEG